MTSEDKFVMDLADAPAIESWGRDDESEIWISAFLLRFLLRPSGYPGLEGYDKTRDAAPLHLLST